MGNAAVILVDIQQAFCSPSGSMARQGRDIGTCVAAAHQCNRLAAVARGAGLPVIWTRYSLRPDYRDGGWYTRELRPNIRVAESLRSDKTDSALWDQADVLPDDFIVDKPRMSSFYATSLEAILRGEGIDTVFVGGVTTSMCVESTVRDASQRDYRTFLVTDACADWAADRHDASLNAIRFGFAHLTTVADIGQSLAGSIDPALMSA
nr:isochorismatase family cysteine hydrolase [Microvirga antarctica]